MGAPLTCPHRHPLTAQEILISPHDRSGLVCASTSVSVTEGPAAPMPTIGDHESPSMRNRDDDAPPEDLTLIAPKVRSDILLSVPVIILLVAGWMHRWMADDGFIYLHIVDHFVAGNGPVFNAGERVEAYTSPAWLVILSIAEIVLPLRLEWIAVTLGLAFAAIGLTLAMAGALRLAGRQRGGRLGVPAGALIVVAPFAMWIWFTSGLEIGLTFAWLGWSLWLLARWADSEGPPGHGALVVLGLGWLIRPELVVFSALFVLVVLAGNWTTTTWPQRLRTLAAMLAVPVAYQIFRMGYFGLITANTAVAKDGSSFVWDRGWSYLRDFIDPYYLWFPISVLAVAGYAPMAMRATTRQRLVLGSFFIAGTICATYVIAVGGDYLHARLFTPALFGFCAPLMAVPLQRRYLGLALLAPWALITIGNRPPQGGLFAQTFAPANFGKVTIEDLGFGEGGRNVAWFEGGDLYVDTNPFDRSKVTRVTFEVSDDLDTPAITASAIGVVAYALGTEVHVVDTLGLAHPIGSHYEPRPERDGKPGHEKPAPPAWLLAEVAAPDQAVEASELGTVSLELYPLTRLLSGDAFQGQVSDARYALTCEPLQRLADAASGHLGPRRFVQNLLRAPANTWVRIPADPTEARRLLCEPGAARSPPP